MPDNPRVLSMRMRGYLIAAHADGQTASTRDALLSLAEQDAKRLANPKPGERWLLVTSGWHMPRAMGLFRKAGFDVEAWPTDYRTVGPKDGWAPFTSVAGGLQRLDFVTKEWLGLAFNWLSGRSDALLPGP